MAATTTHSGLVPLHSQQLKDLESEVKEHDEFINGNGKAGAKQRLGLLEDSVDRIEASIASMNRWIIGLIITIGGSVAVWFITTELPKIVTHVETK